MNDFQRNFIRLNFLDRFDNRFHRPLRVGLYDHLKRSASGERIGGRDGEHEVVRRVDTVFQTEEFQADRTHSPLCERMSSATVAVAIDPSDALPQLAK